MYREVNTTVMTAIQLPGSLVSVEWLAAAILPLSNGEWSFGEQIVVIDASLRALTHGATPLEDFLDVHIPGAFYFDFSTDNKGEGIPPHMLPSAKYFGDKMAAYGIGPDTPVVVYDNGAFNSAPRLWWMLRAFGHTNVGVLDGGLASWVELVGTTQEGPPRPPPLLGENDEPFVAKLDSTLLCVKDDIEANMATPPAGGASVANLGGPFTGTQGARVGLSSSTRVPRPASWGGRLSPSQG